MQSETLTILMVEDNPANAHFVQKLLEGVEAFQFQLIHVSKLAEAKNCLTAQNAISLILLNLSLPDAQGLDTITQVLRVSPNVPIVVINQVGDESLAIGALQQGAQDYLVLEQTDGRLLVRAIRYAIERQRLQLRLRQTNAELRQQSEREALVNRITLALNSELEPQRVLAEIVRQLAPPMNCDCCMVIRSLLDVDKICVEAEYWVNAHNINDKNLIPVTSDWRQVQEILQRNQPVAITSEAGTRKYYSFNEEGVAEFYNDIPDTSSIPLSPVFQAFPLQQHPLTLLLAPITVREQYYGHLLVGYLQPRLVFSPKEILLLQQLARQTALVLQNALQIEQLEQLVEKRTQQLAQEKTLLVAILNSIQEGICVMQADGQVVLTNPAEQKIWGLNSEEMTGLLHTRLEKLQIQESCGTIPTFEELPLIRTQRGEVVRDYELVIQDTQGEQKWISVNGATVCDQAGQIQLAINTTRDITQRKRAEEALIKHDRLLGGVAAAMTQLLITTDYEAAMTRSLTVLSLAANVARVYICKNHINEETGERLTSQRFEWLRDQVAVSNHPKLQNLSYDSGLSRWYKILSAGKALKGLVQDFPQIEREILEPYNICSILLVPIMTEGKFWGFIAFAEDSNKTPGLAAKARYWTDYEESLLTVTAGSIGGMIVRQQTEKALLQAKEAAEAGSRAKSEFLATISHELRTPLNAVLGLSQLMEQEIFGSLNNKQKEYVSCIQSSGQHLLSLINDILDLSKVEAGKEQLSFVPLDIPEICKYCLSMVREQAYEHGLQLTVDIDPQARICIADERRIKQMLLNLLSNAVKFTLKGEVSLIVRKLPAAISFTVADTGIGIAAQNLPLLFEPFRQLDSGLNRQFPGTGLGLALTRSLARLHKGEVTVESKLNWGSKFTILLPYCPKDEVFELSLPQENGECEGQCCTLGANRRILLVESDQRNALLLKDYLQVIGHRVEHLTNSINFLSSVRSFKPHLILMDVQLEGSLTGLELLSALRQESDTKDLKVVMVTAMAMAGDREKCLAAGANDYLSKPIGIAQLESVLMRYL